MLVEHRWGERIALDLPVRLSVRARFVAQGRISHASLSGAVVSTSERIPPQTYIDVELNLSGLRRPKAYRVQAFVVRRTALGIALEWCEFAPWAIRALIAIERSPAMRRRARTKRAVNCQSRGAPFAQSPETHSVRNHELLLASIPADDPTA